MNTPHQPIHLSIDEDVHESIAAALRRHGYDVMNVREANRRGLSDAEQLDYTLVEGRTLFSFNAADYIALHLEYLAENRDHAGIIISYQFSSVSARRLKPRPLLRSRPSATEF